MTSRKARVGDDEDDYYPSHRDHSAEDGDTAAVYKRQPKKGGQVK
jgi:hypothetical protein